MEGEAKLILASNSCLQTSFNSLLSSAYTQIPLTKNETKRKSKINATRHSSKNDITHVDFERYALRRLLAQMYGQKRQDPQKQGWITTKGLLIMAWSWGYGQKVIDKAESLNLVKQKRGPERDWATIVYRAIRQR